MMVELVLVVVIDWVLVWNVRQLVPRDNNNSEGNFQPQRKYMEGWLRLGALGTGNYNITKWDNTKTSQEQASCVPSFNVVVRLIILNWNDTPDPFYGRKFNLILLILFISIIVSFYSPPVWRSLCYCIQTPAIELKWTKILRIFVTSSHNCSHISWYVTRSSLLHFLQP